MKKTLDTRSLLPTLLIAVLVASLVAPLASADELNRVILRVNDEILTLHDYQKRKAAAVTSILSASQLSSQEQQVRIAQVGGQLMQELFRELLLRSRARQLRVTADDAQVEQAVAELAERQGIEDEATLLQALASSGMTLEQLRDNMRKEIVYSQVVGREVTAKIQVSEEEMRAYYRNNSEEFTVPEQRWLKEIIVLEASGASPEELQKMAEEIRGKLSEGGELAEVIEPYKSAELTTGAIDLDWLQESELDQALSEVAWKLEPGAYSEPVASRGGLHILHLAGLKEKEQKGFKEVEQQIMGGLRSRRFNKQMQTFLADLEQTAFIHENLPPDAVGYRTLATLDFTDQEEFDFFGQSSLPSAEDSLPGDEGAEATDDEATGDEAEPGEGGEG